MQASRIEAGRASWRLAPWAQLLLFVLVIFVVRNFHFLLAPDHQEIGDRAATMLQVEQAAQGRAQLGPYSRLGFHHPGPASIYAWTAAQWIFAALPSPVARAHLLQLLINFAFIAAAATWVGHLRREQIAAPLFVTLALLNLGAEAGDVQNAWFSIWGPDVVVAPTLAVLVAVAAIWMGHVAALPLAVLGAGFAVHNHVGTAAVIGPLLAVVLARLMWQRFAARTSVPIFWPIAISTVLAVCFAAPILWQQWTVPAGNLAALWSFAREGEWGSQSPSHAVIIVLSRLAALPSSLLRLIDIDVIARSPWLLSVNTTFLLGSAFFALRDRTSRHGAPMLLVALFALLLGALAALRVTGPLHPYLLRFEFAAATLLGLSSLLYLCAAIEPLRRYCEGHARIKIFAIAMALVILLRR